LGTYGSLSVNSSGTWTYLLADTDADTVALLASNSVATDTFSVIVTDAAGDTASETVTVTVGNRAPTLTTISEITGEDEDNATTITYDMLIAAADEADADGDTISFRVEVVSTGSLTKDDTAVTAGTTTIASGESLVWTPAADANGTLNAFTVKAYDGTSYSSTAVQVQVSVAAVADAPTTGDQTITLNEDTIYTFSASDFTFADVDSGAALASIQLTNFTNPGGGFGIFVDANDDDLYDVGEEVTGSSVINITDIDAGNLKAGASTENSNGDGFATVSFTVSDGTASSAVSGTNTFNVAAVDDAAVIAGDISGSGDEDANISGTLTATDANDGLTDGTYFTVSTDPTNGTATIDVATGAWSYTPTGDYNGSDSFTVTITDDDGHTATQAISLTINAVADAPVAVADSVTILEDATATVISILDNDTDADVGDSISLFSKSNGSNGSVTNNGDGTVSYTPAANFNGSDTFTYTATDGTNTSELGTVTVTVTAVNDDPTGSVTITGDAKTGQTLTASNDLADVDGLGTITYEWTGTKGEESRVATGETLTLSDLDIDYTYTVTASYTDGGSTPESVISDPASAVTDIVKLLQVRNITTTGSVEVKEIDLGGGNILKYSVYTDDETAFTEKDASLEINNTDYSNDSTDPIVKFDLYIDAEGMDTLDTSTVSEISGGGFKLALNLIQSDLDDTYNFTSSTPADWDDTDSDSTNNTEYMEIKEVDGLFSAFIVNESLGGITFIAFPSIVDTDESSSTPLEVKIGTVYLNPKDGVTELQITIQEQLFTTDGVNVEPLSYTVDIL
jgi:VCBS repeat-containing protein